jgi:sulfate transport system permease protein
MADVVVAPVTGSPPPAPQSAGKERPRAAAVGLRTVAVLYVGLLVLVPVVVLVYHALKPGLTTLFDTLRDPDTVHAYEVTAVVAGTALVIDVLFGVAAAVLLVRYRFPGRRLLSAFIDIPIAVSPIVVGLALILVFGPDGWLGSVVQDHVIFARPGMVLATVFVSLPIVARAIVPVLEQAGLEQEQAAASLGANALQRFVRVTLPTIRVALAYGTVLALARCLGEYGAVLVVSGRIEGETETVPIRIGDLFDSNLDANGAYALTLVLMAVSIAAILVGSIIRRKRL